MGAYPLLWSLVVGESPGCGATASSGSMTTPGTPAAGMSGYLPPRPGLPPIDFSKWRLLPPEAPASGGPTAPPNLPGVRRSVNLRSTAKRIVGAPHPGGLAQRMPALPASHAVRAPDGATSPTTTPGAASHTLLASGTTAKEARGEGSRF